MTELLHFPIYTRRTPTHVFVGALSASTGLGYKTEAACRLAMKARRHLPGELSFVVCKFVDYNAALAYAAEIRKLLGAK